MQTLIFVITGIFVLLYIIDRKAPNVPEKVDYLKTKGDKVINEVEVEQDVDNGVFNNILNLLAPVLNSISNEVFTFGEVGKGQEVKAINQILVAGTYCAVAEAIALGQSLNLPMELVVDALKNGAAGSWALEHRSKGMLNDVYPLGFKLALHHKDLCIAIKTAKQKGLNLKVTNQVKELEEILIQKGYMNEDISVIKRYLNRFEKRLN